MSLYSNPYAIRSSDTTSPPGKKPNSVKPREENPVLGGNAGPWVQALTNMVPNMENHMTPSLVIG